MPTELEPIELGTVTPLRRIRSITIQTHWELPGGAADRAAEEKISATYEYEVAYLDNKGNQVIPAKHDGYVALNDSQCRALPNLMSGLAAITQAGETVKEAQSDVAPVEV